MVLKTNRKTVELDLIKRYNTIFAIRHLVDGGTDRRFSRSSNGFTSLRKSDKSLFTNWYVTEIIHFLKMIMKMKLEVIKLQLFYFNITSI